jgi:hypothetical protein
MAQGTRPSPGDFTGKQKAALAREQQQATEDREVEMSMANETQSYEERVGVFDAQSGERVDQAAPSQVAVEVEERPQPGFPTRPEEMALSGKEDPETMAQLLSEQRAARPAPNPNVVRSPFSTIRVDQDIEDMTYGMKNGEPDNYTFREGLTYRVPTPVAEHLDERGLVRQWIGS